MPRQSMLLPPQLTHSRSAIYVPSHVLSIRVYPTSQAVQVAASEHVRQLETHREAEQTTQ